MFDLNIVVLVLGVILAGLQAWRTFMDKKKNDKEADASDVFEVVKEIVNEIYVNYVRKEKDQNGGSLPEEAKKRFHDMAVDQIVKRIPALSRERASLLVEKAISFLKGLITK